MLTLNREPSIAMKRIFLIAAIAVCLIRLPAAGQAGTGGASAAANDAREELEERFKQMSADMDSLHAANQALEQKIAALEDEIRQLREAQSRAAANTSIQDDLKRLADKIEEVDRKRAEDKEAISEQIRQSTSNLEKTLAANASAPVHQTAPPARTRPEADVKPSGPGFSYTVQPGDFLAAIVKAYNTDFRAKGMKTVTLRQVMDANPGIDWNRLRVGQRIVIPKPE